MRLFNKNCAEKYLSTGRFTIYKNFSKLFASNAKEEPNKQNVEKDVRSFNLSQSGKGGKSSSSKGASQVYSNLKEAPGLGNFFRTEITNTHNQPIETVIVADHTFIKSIYQQLEEAHTLEDKLKWRNMLIYEISRHSIAEELILYPLFRNNFPEGEEYFHSSTHEHHETKQKLAEIQPLSPEDASFEEKIKSMWKPLHEHMEKEEKEILPQLTQVLEENKRIFYANQFGRRKFFVPTRPHTLIPENPPTINSLLGAFTAPIDKLRDIFAAYPDQNKVADLKKEAFKSDTDKEKDKWCRH